LSERNEFRQFNAIWSGETGSSRVFKRIIKIAHSSRIRYHEIITTSRARTTINVIVFVDDFAYPFVANAVSVDTNYRSYRIRNELFVVGRYFPINIIVIRITPAVYILKRKLNFKIFKSASETFKLHVNIGYINFVYTRCVHVFKSLPLVLIKRIFDF